MQADHWTPQAGSELSELLKSVCWKKTAYCDRRLPANVFQFFYLLNKTAWLTVCHSPVEKKTAETTSIENHSSFVCSASWICRFRPIKIRLASETQRGVSKLQTVTHCVEFCKLVACVQVDYNHWCGYKLVLSRSIQISNFRRPNCIINWCHKLSWKTKVDLWSTFSKGASKNKTKKQKIVWWTASATSLTKWLH